MEMEFMFGKISGCDDDANATFGLPISAHNRQETISGVYTVRIGYKLLGRMQGIGRMEQNHSDKEGWKLIWLSKLPPRIKMLLWRAGNNILLISSGVNRFGQFKIGRNFEGGAMMLAKGGAIIRDSDGALARKVPQLQSCSAGDDTSIAVFVWS
ncbi:DNA-directed RNA polymerase subunit beta' [Gossypium arboreum]|uniref:DNA-directed RNA polymerase subunit beta n=1 Tax=Gossypium arboreum TaxID=29729 RepID=A0A0B0PGI8_GOSAR|nr:DNA-directed RNA polymerase subunit beta' [Gossypium arboreum]